MQRIALDTIRSMEISKEFRYIIAIIDRFTRYVELFPAYDVTATDALWRHFCRFGTPGSGFPIHKPDSIELRDTFRGVA